VIYLVARYEGKLIACIRGCIETSPDGALVCELWTYRLPVSPLSTLCDSTINAPEREKGEPMYKIAYNI
jgi:hypothetical protein